MSLTDAVSKAFATIALLLGGLVVLLAVLALLGLVFPPCRRAVRWVRTALYGSEFWLAFVIALAAVAGSLFFSEHAGFIPCRLCWFQRIAMYPLAIILLVAAVRRDRRGGVWYAIAFPILGAGVSIYHLYIEAHPEDELAGCKIGAPCSTKWIDVFGFMTIPALALAAFAAIFTLLVLAWPRKSDEDTDPPDDEAGEPDDEPLPHEPAAAGSLMRRALAAGVTLAAVALGGAGCGSGDGGSTGGSTAASPGAKVFADTGCGSCHTLKAAGSTGTVGPVLDGRDYDLAAVERWVATGGNGMPAYKGRLSPEDLRSVAAFVTAASRKN